MLTKRNVETPNMPGKSAFMYLEDLLLCDYQLILVQKIILDISECHNFFSNFALAIS